MIARDGRPVGAARGPTSSSGPVSSGARPGQIRSRLEERPARRRSYQQRDRVGRRWTSAASRSSEIIAAVGGVLLAISVFLPWY